MPTVSVIVPSHNDAPMLAACLRALADQARAADEIIVVDNASADDTAEVARAAGARVVSEPRLGVLAATAAGFDAATGEVLARLDADSVPAADWVARVAAAFDESPDLTGLTGPGEFYGKGRVTHWIAEHIYIGGYQWFVGALLRHPPLFGSNLALRAQAWERIRDRVHRDRREVHDDLELSIHILPDMIVRYDPTLRVGVSARPFDSARGLWRRAAWAWVTYSINRRDGSLRRRQREYADHRRVQANRPA